LTTREIIEVSNLGLNARELARDDLSSAGYLETLRDHSLFHDAVSFRAHELPTNLAIEWGAACIRELRAPDQRQDGQDSLDSVERWVRTPNDATRWAAKECADKAGISSPADCLAMAVFFSGGSMTPPGTPDTPPPPYAARKMVAGSIAVAVLSHTPEKAADRYRLALALSKDVKMILVDSGR
jgi:hypothetical protein